jgi:hypothetical protein
LQANTKPSQFQPVPASPPRPYSYSHLAPTRALCQASTLALLAPRGRLSSLTYIIPTHVRSTTHTHNIPQYVASGCTPHITAHMSEVQSRPARGRSSARGGRGGYSARGPRKTNGDGASDSIDTSAEQGELAELKKRYSSQLTTLKELFPDWTDADLVLAVDDADGDLQTTIERISEGKRLLPPCLTPH